MSGQKLGQILEKPCVCSRGHIFGPIIMKLGQNVCLDVILDSLKMCHVRTKSRSLGQMLEKCCVRSRGHIFSPIIMVRMFVLMKSWTSSKTCFVRSETRSLGQNLENLCVCSRGHIFGPIIMKPGQNICLDEISNKFENGSCQVKN